jgi:hypothetical protein
MREAIQPEDQFEVSGVVNGNILTIHYADGGIWSRVSSEEEMKVLDAMNKPIYYSIAKSKGEGK